METYLFHSPTDVIFVDGSVAKDVDAIILATGYNYTFPFLEENMIELKHNAPSMYKHMFRVEEKPSIAFIGCLQPVGCMFSVAELQARLATRVFKGLVKLPSVKEMKQDIAQDFERKQSECYDAQKHATRVRTNLVPRLFQRDRSVRAKSLETRVG
jgi:dimethylaniline monooxygenase (N-oxide forming)